MQTAARDLAKGDFVMGVGTVEKVHLFENDVAATGKTVTKMPKLKGALLHARAAAEAAEVCYTQQAATVVVEFRGSISRKSYHPDAVLEILRPVNDPFVLPKAA